MFIGCGMFGSSQSATRSSIEIDAAQVSAILRTPGVTSYLSIHYNLSVMSGVKIYCLPARLRMAQSSPCLQ